jgi:hypothetical protein
MKRKRGPFMLDLGNNYLMMESQKVSDLYHFFPQTNFLAMEQKIQTLHDTLNTYKISFTQGSEVLNINRENIFDESLEQFMDMNLQKVRRRILIV